MAGTGIQWSNEPLQGSDFVNRGGFGRQGPLFTFRGWLGNNLEKPNIFHPRRQVHVRAGQRSCPRLSRWAPSHLLWAAPIKCPVASVLVSDFTGGRHSSVREECGQAFLSWDTQEQAESAITLEDPVWLHTPVIPALWKPRLQDCMFEASQGQERAPS